MAEFPRCEASQVWLAETKLAANYARLFQLGWRARRSSRQPARLRPLGYAGQSSLASRAKTGGAERDRTADLLIANEALSQLSYSPKAAPVIASGAGRVSMVWRPALSRLAIGWNAATHAGLRKARFGDGACLATPQRPPLQGRHNSIRCCPGRGSPPHDCSACRYPALAVQHAG